MGDSEGHATRWVCRQLFQYVGACARRDSVRIMDGTMTSAIHMQNKQHCVFNEPLPCENIACRWNRSYKNRRFSETETFRKITDEELRA